RGRRPAFDGEDEDVEHQQDQQVDDPCEQHPDGGSGARAGVVADPAVVAFLAVFLIGLWPGGRARPGRRLLAGEARGRGRGLRVDGGRRRPRLLGRREDLVTNRTANVLAEHVLGETEGAAARRTTGLKHGHLPGLEGPAAMRAHSPATLVPHRWLMRIDEVVKDIVPGVKGRAIGARQRNAEREPRSAYLAR